MKHAITSADDCRWQSRQLRRGQWPKGTPGNARSRARHTRVVNRLGVMLDDMASGRLMDRGDGRVSLETIWMQASE